MEEYYKERAETYKRIAEELWQVLDDIDTLSDIIKPMGIYGFEEFYRGTMKKVKKRKSHMRNGGVLQDFIDGIVEVVEE